MVTKLIDPAHGRLRGGCEFWKFGHFWKNKKINREWNHAENRVIQSEGTAAIPPHTNRGQSIVITKKGVFVDPKVVLVIWKLFWWRTDYTFKRKHAQLLSVMHRLCMWYLSVWSVWTLCEVWSKAFATDGIIMNGNFCKWSEDGMQVSNNAARVPINRVIEGGGGRHTKGTTVTGNRLAQTIVDEILKLLFSFYFRCRLVQNFDNLGFLWAASHWIHRETQQWKCNNTVGT